LKFVRAGTLALVIAGAALIAPGSSLAAGGGIDTVGATPTAATASPLQLNGVLVLNKSDASTSGANVTVLQVAGLNLLSKNGAGVNQGMLAFAGTLLDTLNKALCAKGTEASGFCLALLFTNTKSGPVNHGASGATAAITLGSIHLRLLGSEASSTAIGTVCGTTGLAYVLNMSNVPAAPGINIQNGALGGPGAC
jgi:hypothetical protein